LALAVSVVLATACAVVEPPPGGPIDITPARLTTMNPDSGTTGIGDLQTIRLTFSEKMDRTSAITWLYFFPDQRIRQTKWHGAIEAEVILEFPLPPDTVIVVEVATGMRDAHKVPSPYSRRFPISTGDSIPTGVINGILIMADSAVTNGVVELYDVPPDTLEYFQQPLLRRTTTNESGAYRFDWLPVPGGPWLVRAFTDPDNNLRPGDRDAQRLLPDTLSLTPDLPVAAAPVTTLFAWNTPGQVLVGPFDPPDQGVPVKAWTLAMADEDTGWVPVPEGGQTHPIFPLDPASGGVIGEVQPGRNRVLVFVDVDGDSTFSGVPDTLLAFVPDSLRTTLPDSVSSADWFLEPWLMVEEIFIEPGLDSELNLPALPYNLTPWTKPEPAAILPDSLLESGTDGADLGDGAEAADDSLTVTGEKE
jgi:hypothetical protein